VLNDADDLDTLDSIADADDSSMQLWVVTLVITH